MDDLMGNISRQMDEKWKVVGAWTNKLANGDDHIWEGWNLAHCGKKEGDAVNPWEVWL